MAYDIEKNEVIFRGRVFNLERLTVRLPDEKLHFFDMVRHPGAVVILPLDDQGQIWFVRQYRLGAMQELLELPAGTLEPGEKPEVCAAREIREETGLAAGKLVKLGEFFMAPGYTSEYLHIYLGTDLHPAPLEGDADEFIHPEAISLEKVKDMVKEGVIRDGKTLATLLLAQNYLEK